jgi:DNA-binding HxlR family transcriptional regulator
LALRFAELRNLLRGVSEKVLTAQLRELEKDGVINRTAVLSSPPKVTYSLSPSGQTLIPLLEGLCDWGSKQFGIKPNLPAIPAQRENFLATRLTPPRSLNADYVIVFLTAVPLSTGLAS